MPFEMDRVVDRMEALEKRVLLAWGMFPQIIDQDAAVERFPEIDGSGFTVVDIDSGFTGNHEALAGKLWTNPGEVAGNGVDDDGDGYADNVNGWDYVGGSGNVADDQGHGTMTGGITRGMGRSTRELQRGQR